MFQVCKDHSYLYKPKVDHQVSLQNKCLIPCRVHLSIFAPNHLEICPRCKDRLILSQIKYRGVRKCLFKRLFAFKIGKIDLNIKRLNGILFKTVRLLCLKGPECLTRLESLKQNRFKQIMHHDV